MSSTLHLAVAQIQARAGAVAANLARIERQTHAASIHGCDAILFAETCCHAYVFAADNLALAEEASRGPATAEVLRLAMRYRVAVLAGFLERTAAGICNSQFCARPDGSWFVARKTQLTDTELAAGLVRGDGQFNPFILKGVPIAVVICADGGHPELAVRMREHGARYRFCPTAGGDVLFGEKQAPIHSAELASEAGRQRYERLRGTVFDARPIQERQADTLGGFASANALGDDGAGTQHLGHCMIVDNDLVLRAQIPGTPVAEHQLDQMAHAVIEL